MTRGHLFILSAPSGAGKSTLINLATSQIPNIWHSISGTTRKPRDYEKEGVHYFFMERDVFKKFIDNKLFLEWAKVHGEFYGTPTKAVDEHLDKGDNVIMDLDVQGALHVKQKRPETKLVFIMPPSLRILRERMEVRRTETEEDMLQRLSIAQKEMDCRSQYDFIIINDLLDEAFHELKSIIQGNISTYTETTT